MSERVYFSTVESPDAWAPLEWIEQPPPCDFCRREIPCECSTTTDRVAGDDTCMCTCGRCQAPLGLEF